MSEAQGKAEIVQRSVPLTAPFTQSTFLHAAKFKSWKRSPYFVMTSRCQAVSAIVDALRKTPKLSSPEA